MLKNNKLKFLFKLVFGFAWTLIACELFLRLLHPVPVVPRYVTAGSFGIRVNEPNRQYWHSSADFKIQIRTNAQGIRADYDILYEKPAGTKRIVVLGDSFSMGYEVSLEDSFLVQMEKRLKAAGEKVEIVNLSVSGHGNAEELLMLQNEGIKYHPDLVLVCFNSTDLDDNVRCGLFTLDNGTLKRANPEFLPGVKTQQMLNKVPGYNWIAANSTLYSFAREQFTWHIAKKLLVLKQDILRSFDSADPDPAATQNAAPPVEDNYAQRLTVALLQEIKRTSENAGAKLLILDIPSQGGVGRFDSSFPKMVAGADTFDIVSPADVFVQRQEHLIYWTRSQRHFTPFGCELVGDTLAKHILGGPWRR